MKAVSVRRGETVALTEVDLTVEPGEAVAFIGPSGAGKTTLLDLLTAAVVPTDGSIHVDGDDLSKLASDALRRWRSRVGFIHQDLRLVPNLRVIQNVLSGDFGRRGFGQSVRMMLRPGAEDQDRVHRMLERVGIPEKMYNRVDQLSGGQAQRVAVARALFPDPALLLADEPVASVDPVRARDLLELLTGICREQGVTLCVSLHRPDLVRQFFRRVIGLRAGRIVFDGPSADLYDATLDEIYRLERTDEG